MEAEAASHSRKGCKKQLTICYYILGSCLLIVQKGQKEDQKARIKSSCFHKWMGKLRAEDIESQGVNREN